jgi:hypothetical protein
VHGQFAEDLAIELHLALVEHVDEARVTDAVLPNPGVEALDPQLAELPPAEPPVAVGVLPGPLDALDGRAEVAIGLTAVAFGGLDDFLVVEAFGGKGSSLGCCYVCCWRRRLCGRRRRRGRCSRRGSRYMSVQAKCGERRRQVGQPTSNWTPSNSHYRPALLPAASDARQYVMITSTGTC